MGFGIDAPTIHIRPLDAMAIPPTVAAYRVAYAIVTNANVPHRDRVHTTAEQP
jgi:hypothetical protein